MRSGAVDIRRLAAKGLSGKEAGRLALAHLQRVERGRPGLLSATDIEGLRACLRDERQEADYRRMMGLHSAACLMIAEAQIASLQIVSLLEEARRELFGCLCAASPRELVGEALKGTLATARMIAGVLLAYRQVLAEMGEIAGGAFDQDLLPIVPFELRAMLTATQGQGLLDDVKTAAGRYDFVRELLLEKEEAESILVPAFELSELAAHEGVLEILRERVALGGSQRGLGACWWQKTACT